MPSGPCRRPHLLNVGHVTLVPAVALGIGYWQADHLVIALALIWLAHIGLNRLLGLGPKDGALAWLATIKRV
ncbi:MAG TPA: DUF4260 family protein [Acidimicrobiales bacterium]|nr:DUF4260 family protein [Acidimicrobiales bacterium]